MLCLRMCWQKSELHSLRPGGICCSTRPFLEEMYFFANEGENHTNNVKQLEEMKKGTEDAGRLRRDFCWSNGFQDQSAKLPNSLTKIHECFFVLTIVFKHDPTYNWALPLADVGVAAALGPKKSDKSGGWPLSSWSKVFVTHMSAIRNKSLMWADAILQSHLHCTLRLHVILGEMNACPAFFLSSLCVTLYGIIWHFIYLSLSVEQ